MQSIQIVPITLRTILSLEFIWLVDENCLSEMIPKCLRSSTNLTRTLLNKGVKREMNY